LRARRGPHLGIHRTKNTHTMYLLLAYNGTAAGRFFSCSRNCVEQEICLTDFMPAGLQKQSHKSDCTEEIQKIATQISTNSLFSNKYLFLFAVYFPVLVIFRYHCNISEVCCHGKLLFPVLMSKSLKNHEVCALPCLR
jgi:hypothetical protein